MMRPPPRADLCSLDSLRKHGEGPLWLSLHLRGHARPEPGAGDELWIL